MKKTILTGVLLTTLLFGTYVKAEEGDNTGIEVAQTEQSKSTTENNVEMAKSEVISKIKNMYNSQIISEEEMNNFLNRLNQVTKVDDIEVIVKEADTIISNYFLEMTKNDISFNIKKLYEEKRITEKEMNDFLSRIEQATSIKEVEVISGEAWAISNNHNLEITKSDISNILKDMKKNNKISQELLDQFLAKLDKATTEEEASAVLVEAKKLVEDLSKWGFAEHYLNLKNNIELLVEKGDLTKEQGDSFLAKAESAKTVQELDVIWEEVQQQVEANKKGKTTSSTEKETKNDSKSTNQLPKTGESKINVGLVGIGLTLILSFVVIKFKSRKFNN